MHVGDDMVVVDAALRELKEPVEVATIMVVNDLNREEARPTYDLVAIQAALDTIESLAITTSALRHATALGFDRAGVVGVVQSIGRKMFVKSMTAYADHRVWQDIYHVPSSDLVLYVKLQADVLTEFRVMSFKEK